MYLGVTDETEAERAWSKYYEEHGEELKAQSSANPKTSSSQSFDKSETLKPESKVNASVIEPTPGSHLLAPYREWDKRDLPDPLTSNRTEIAEALTDIVKSEGPMLAICAYRIYAKASGINKINKSLRSTFNKAAFTALENNYLKQINDETPGQMNKTLFAPGNQPVVMREKGSRDVLDIPPSEIKALAKELGISADIDHKICEMYGLPLTDLISEFISKCLKA